MPVKRRRPKARRFLSFRERRWLLSGQPGALLYLERARVEALWCEHGDTIVARHVDRYPGSRPVNWWRFDAPEPRCSDESQSAYLKRRGLLLPGERERLRPCDFSAEAVT
jgi:hypothetical protein